MNEPNQTKIDAAWRKAALLSMRLDRVNADLAARWSGPIAGRGKSMDRVIARRDKLVTALEVAREKAATITPIYR